MKKRWLSLLVTLCLFAGLLTSPVLAANNPFTDVKSGRFYYEAVLWAAENGITTGTTKTTFSPDDPCTRGQIVTFLWRSVGSPEPSIAQTPFTDLVPTAYYNKAVRWAVENGITTGTTKTTFGPEDPCTRGQIVTFLWRTVGSPDSGTGKTPFTDLVSTAYYNKAVRWAVENGVTTGVTDTTFCPEDSCTRGQIVTFLYRTMHTEDEPENPNEPENPTEPEVPADSIVKTETIQRTVDPTLSEAEAYWHFAFYFQNPSNQEVRMTKVTIQDISGGVDMGSPYEIVVEESILPTMFDLVASPGETIFWEDNHPVTYAFNGRRYTLEFQNTSGQTFTKTYVLELSYEGYTEEGAEQAVGFGETGTMTALLGVADRWDYTLWFRNNTDQTLTLKRIETRDYFQGENVGAPYIHTGERLQDLIIPQTLAPGQVGSFSDGHPWVDYFDEREYKFIYVDAKDVEYTATIRITMSSSQYHPELEKTYPDFSGDQSKDAYTLRHDASYNQKVAEGVYWVPANTLGKSNYTNAQIQSMLTKTPEEKQAGIDTLFEALQLFQIGSFYGSDDNVWIYENGCEWEHHKPGYHAVRTNNGCCASCANWLHYILQDDYDEVGFIATNSLSGGHVFNYIKEGSWYYFVDLTTWYAENMNVNAIESGKMADYYNSDYINGNIHRATSIDAFVNYMLSDYSNPPGLIYTYQAENVIALASVWTASGGIEIVYSDTVPITFHHDDLTDTLSYRIAAAPTKNKDWSRDEDFAFDKLVFE